MAKRTHNIQKIRQIIREELSHLGVKDKLFKMSLEDALENEEVTDSVFDLIQQAYSKIGGHPKVRDKSGLKNYTNWAVADVDADPEVDVAFLGKPDKSGKGIKTGASATDGTKLASQAWRDFRTDLGKDGWWAEVSGAPAHVMINKMGEPYVDDEATVRELLKGKDITWHGAHPTEPERWPGVTGWYSRKIGNKEHAKIIVGNF